MRELDNWDLRLVHHLKQGGSYAGVVKIWAERCGMDEQYVRPLHMVDAFVRLSAFLGRGTLSDLIVETHPSNAWRYERDDWSGLGDDHYRRCLLVLTSRIRHTLVVDIPGYAEFLKS